MRFLRSLLDFVVGDDWHVAGGVVLALAITALVDRAGIAAWWVLPIAVAGLLTYSVMRAARGS